MVVLNFYTAPSNISKSAKAALASVWIEWTNILTLKFARTSKTVRLPSKFRKK